MQNDNPDSLARVIKEMRDWQAKDGGAFGVCAADWADRLAAMRQVPEDAASHIAAQAGAELPEWEDGDSPEALAIACECIYQAASTYDTFDQLPKAAALIRRLTGAHGFPALPETRFAMNGARLYTADQMHAYAREAKRLAALRAQGAKPSATAVDVHHPQFEAGFKAGMMFEAEHRLGDDAVRMCHNADGTWTVFIDGARCPEDYASAKDALDDLRRELVGGEAGELDHLRTQIRVVGDLLMNMKPHIPQALEGGRPDFIDNYVIAIREVLDGTSALLPPQHVVGLTPLPTRRFRVQADGSLVPIDTDRVGGEE